MDALERFAAVRPPGSAAGGTWFGLGDQDLATHLYRTHRLAEGGSLTEVTAEIAAAYGVAVRLLPVTDDPLAHHADRGRRGRDRVPGVLRRAAPRRPDQRRPLRRRRGGRGPARGVARRRSTRRRSIVIAPSNPIVSIGPVLAVPGVRERSSGHGADASSPSRPSSAAGRSRAPPTGCWPSSATPVSVVGVARLYRDAGGHAGHRRGRRAPWPREVEAEGVRCVVTDTVMRDARRRRRAGRGRARRGRPGTRVSRLDGVGRRGHGRDPPGRPARRARGRRLRRTAERPAGSTATCSS